MYNVIEYSLNYSDMTGSLWIYSKNEPTNFNADITNSGGFKSFQYKVKLLRDTIAQPAPNDNHAILENVTIAVPLKYQSSIWRSLEMRLNNCKDHSK